MGGSWGCAAGADGAWGRWLWAAQLGRLLRELGSFSLRPPAPRREPGLGSNLACAPQPLFFLQVPAEGDAQGEHQGLLAGGFAGGSRGHGGALGCSLARGSVVCVCVAAFPVLEAGRMGLAICCTPAHHMMYESTTQVCISCGPLTTNANPRTIPIPLQAAAR